MIVNASDYMDALSSDMEMDIVNINDSVSDSDIKDLPFSNIDEIITYEDGSKVYIQNIDNSVLEYQSDSEYDVLARSADLSEWEEITNNFTYNFNNYNFTGYKTFYVPWDVMGYSVVDNNGTLNYRNWLYSAFSGDVDFTFSESTYNITNTARNSRDRVIIGFSFVVDNVTFENVNNATANTNLESKFHEVYALVTLGKNIYKVPISNSLFYFDFENYDTSQAISIQPHVAAGIFYRGSLYNGSNSYLPPFAASVKCNINNFRLRLLSVYARNFISSGDITISEGVQAMSSLMHTDLSNFSSGMHSDLTNIYSMLNNIYVRNHNDLVAINDNNIKWYTEIANRITTWGGNLNTTLINWFTTTNQNMISFYNRNHSDLVQIHTDLTKYDSTAGGLDGANEQFKSEMDDYKQNTDTSVQYSKITDDIFDLDTDFFTSLASTATFFSSLVTMAFNSLGDFAVALTMFLVLMFVSMVLGIVSRMKGGD